jgi:hypothetical protein
MSETRWRCVQVETDGPCEDGTVGMYFLVEAEGNDLFFVSVSGQATSSATHFIQAFQAAAQALAHTCGTSIPGARIISPEETPELSGESLYQRH